MISKLKISNVLILAFAVTFTFSCCPEECDERPILILYAFEAEGELLGGAMEIEQTDTVLNREVYCGDLGEKDIVLAESGMGMTNAAMTAQKMIDRYNPTAVIFSGIAGGIDTSVHIGDITICEKWVSHDYGYIGKDGLEPFDVQVALSGEDSLVDRMYFRVDSALLGQAILLSQEEFDFDSIGTHLPRLIIGGVGVSGNQFIDQVEKRLWLSEYFGALVTDMETASVAQVCAVNGVPFIAFRSASDLAGGSGSSTATEEIGQFFEVAASNSAEVVMKYVEIME